MIGAEGEASSDTPVAVHPIDVVPRSLQSNMNVCVDEAVGATNPKCNVFGPSIIVNGCSNSQDAVSMPVGQAMRYVVASCLSYAIQISKLQKVLFRTSMSRRAQTKLTEATGYATTGYARLNKSAVVATTSAVLVFALTPSIKFEARKRIRKFKDSGVDRNISFLNPIAMHACACLYVLPSKQVFTVNKTEQSKAKPKTLKPCTHRGDTHLYHSPSPTPTKHPGDDGNEAILFDCTHSVITHLLISAVCQASGVGLAKREARDAGDV